MDANDIQQCLISSYNQPQQSLNLQNQTQIWAHILRNQDWKSLKMLSLNSCQITPSGVEVITKLSLPELQQLELSYNHIDGWALNKIIQCQLPKLSIISLMHNQLTFSSSFLTLSNTFFDTIQNINLNNNPIGSTGIKMLSKRQFPNLSLLYLKKSDLGNQGAVHLAKTRWPMMKNIDIGFNKIGSDGFAALCNYQLKLAQLVLVWGNQPIWEVVYAFATNIPSTANIYCLAYAAYDIQILDYMEVAMSGRPVK